MKIKLECTYDDWHGLSVAIDRARDGTKLISVDKDALARLMADHSQFINMKKGELVGDV